ncbi:hypothetical protein GSI_10854 [Ganoderma sinense ZZ0214-1]|uniref:Oxysterol-binding protein n=1 Tax=Ganoderma sinense ZZ0214-1 TaxID=1077348 RepID=A0A2G8S1R9_9APHY|nr:hypothetical protein GSI_10854 [Ganoderma sinense ZZ0214-1]
MASLDKTDAANALDEDAPGQPISVPDSGDTGESGKLKMIIQLVKKCLGVKDIAAMRLSLPASLLEPIPNLEYWQYLDRPDLFAAINDSDDPFERMLAVLRFTFSKDLKFIRGKVCKPYNSVLGEHFRSHWDVIPVSYPSDPNAPPIQHLYLTPPAPEPAQTSSSYFFSSVTHSTPNVALPTLSESASIKSGKSGFSGLSFMSRGGQSTTAKTTPSTSPELVETNLAAGMSDLSLAADLVEADEGPADQPRIRVVYLTEQVSHHPPVSAYYAACPSRHMELAGIDQISAKVSGTTLRVMPGSFNKGIFVRITGEAGAGETYHITHPVAAVNGLLRGSFYVTVGDSTIITCSGGAADGQKLRAVIEYKEESWLGKAQFALEGVIHAYDPTESVHEEWTRVKHVPRDRVIAVFDGSWRGRVRWKRVDALDSEFATLLDISTLAVVPKTVRPLERQLPTESRKLWENVTTRLIKKEYGDATKHKLVIEQKQRDDAAERKRRGVHFTPKYFEQDISTGMPTLTEEGRKAIEEELREKSEHTLEDATPTSVTPSSKSD